MTRVIAFLVALFLTMDVNAQQHGPADPKLLSLEDCAQITKRSDSEFYVKGPVKIGLLTIRETNIPKGSTIIGGIDQFDIIQRSCYSGKST